MFGYISKKLRYQKLKTENDRQLGETRSAAAKHSAGKLLSSSLKENLQTLQGIFCGSSDMIIREFTFGINRQVKGALIYIEGMTNIDLVQKNILQPLMYSTKTVPQNKTVDFSDIDTIKEELLSVGEIKKISHIDNLIDSIFSGSTILLVDGTSEALDMPARKFDYRGVDEPQTESVVRGPRCPGHRHTKPASCIKIRNRRYPAAEVF